MLSGASFIFWLLVSWQIMVQFWPYWVVWWNRARNNILFEASDTFGRIDLGLKLANEAIDLVDVDYFSIKHILTPQTFEFNIFSHFNPLMHINMKIFLWMEILSFFPVCFFFPVFNFQGYMELMYLSELCYNSQHKPI